jgi:hypothetical protein
MRSAIVLLFSILLTSLAVSQISLVSTDAQSFFAPGKSWRMMENYQLTATMNVGSASASAQSWIMPSVVFEDTLRTDNVLPSSTPYASKFPRATHAQRQVFSDGSGIMTSYSYDRITTDSLIDLGSASRNQASDFDTTYFWTTNRVEMTFPFTFGKTISSRDSTSYFPGSYIIQKSTSAYDAFGSIALPAGTFQGLRWKHTSINQTVYNGVPVSTDTSVSFTWITKEGYFLDVTPKDKNPGEGTIEITGLSYTSVGTTPSGIEERGPTVPSTPVLSQNYPNPFNPTTAISYQLPTASTVTLKVYDVLGKEVATLIEGAQSAGIHTVRFDGSSLRSGVYFYRIQAGSFEETKKLVLIK